MAIRANEHGTTDQLAGKAHEAVDRAAETAGKAKEQAQEHASHADERLRKAISQGNRQADEAVDRVTDHVRANPLISMSLAFIAGALYAWLTGRR